MDDRDWPAQKSKENRPHLRAVAYRMFDSLGEADDAVQEAWLRLNRSDAKGLENLSGWLITVIGRVCPDMLRSPKSRQEESLDEHLPDFILSREDCIDPEQETLIADFLGLALLVVWEALAPHERLSFVLHDMFAVPFEGIAANLGLLPSRGKTTRKSRSPQSKRSCADSRRWLLLSREKLLMRFSPLCASAISRHS